jgi:hypothetical protein
MASGQPADFNNRSAIRSGDREERLNGVFFPLIPAIDWLFSNALGALRRQDQKDGHEYFAEKVDAKKPQGGHQ